MTTKTVSVWLGGAALLGVGITLGWLSSRGNEPRPKGDLAAGTLTVHRLRLTDDQGRTRAQLKSEGEETSFVFFDENRRERLTLALGQAGVAIAVNGRSDSDKMVLSINDSLKTTSVYLSADTSAINLVGTNDAQLKISNSLKTDARSTSLGVAGAVTMLRLSTDGAEAQLFTKSESERDRGGDETKEEPAKVAEINLRTAMTPEVRFRLSSDTKPLIQLPPSDSKTTPARHTPLTREHR